MRKLVVLLCLFLIAACESGTGPDDSPVGTYVLESVDGNPLPAKIVGGTVHAATVVLRADGSYAAETTTSFPDPATGKITTHTASGTGTYRLSGNTLTVTAPSGQTTSATYNGSTITATSGPYLFLYRRQ